MTTNSTHSLLIIIPRSQWSSPALFSIPGQSGSEIHLRKTQYTDRFQVTNNNEHIEWKLNHSLFSTMDRCLELSSYRSIC